MLKFLKSFFTKKEIEKEEISLNEMENWFNDKTKIIFNNLDKKIEDEKLKINGEIKKCIENLETLKNTELKNPNIPIRAKQAMEGNRDAYIKRVKIFLDYIGLEDNDYDKILNFCNNFDTQLNNLGKSTLKSYQILQEFLANESSDIAINIRNLDNLIKELKNLFVNSKIETIETIKNEISNLKIKINKKNDLEEELNNKQNHIEELKKSKEYLENEINNFKKSQDFVNFQNLEREKDLIIKDIDNHKNTLLHSFSVLEKAFKKFSRIVFENEKLVKNYTISPLKTLIEDNELKIIKILDNLEKNILDNKLDIEERKKQKSLNEIKKLNRDFFTDFLTTFKNLKEKLDEINNELENNETENKNVELNKKLNLIKTQLETSENDINNLKIELETINIEELKDNLQEKINSTINKNIVIS